MISLHTHPHPDELLGVDRNPKFKTAVEARQSAVAPHRARRIAALALSAFVAAAVLLLTAGSASADVYTILHNFGDGSVPHDGTEPDAGLIQATDGNFYGTTVVGGSADEGTVFKITPSGAVTILHSFGDGSVPNDGEGPEAGLIQATDGDFYGTTAGGGAGDGGEGAGTVFKITPSGSVTILHSFGDGSVLHDGEVPQAGLIQATDGDFYGTTDEGGDDVGTVFKITPSGAVTILHSFRDGSVPNDGKGPEAGLIQATDGDFYGTTAGGGAGDGGEGAGTVFEITPLGVETILHSFDDGSVSNDGLYPEAGLIQATNGNFYGTTELGGGANGGGEGTAFKITPLGVVTILHSFGNPSVPNDGAEPYAALIQATDGNFYGTTRTTSSEGGGTAFEMTPSGAVTILHSFYDGSVPNDGEEPFAGLIQATNGNFYGTTYNGGSGDSGTVFEITSGIVSPPVLTSISPSSAAAGSGQFTLIANGSGFVSRSVVRWNGVSLPTTYVSADKLTATVPADKITTVGTASVTAFTSAPGGGTSAAKTFTITTPATPAPVLTSISPTSATAGSAAFTLTVHGSRFVLRSVVHWNGVALPTTYVSATELTANVPADKITALGTASVTAFTSAPGGGTSAAATFTVVSPSPVLTSIGPTSTAAGSAAFTLTVHGSRFMLRSVVQWNGTALPTTYVSATELTAIVPAGLITTVGTASVTVFTPAPGGGTSAPATFTIATPATPAPVLTSIGPTSTPATCSAGFTLTVHGSRFVPRSVVRWKGAALPTTYVSATELKAAVPAKIIMVAGTASVTVFTPGPGGGTSAAVTFTIGR